MALKTDTEQFVITAAEMLRFPDTALTDREASAEYLQKIRGVPITTQSVEPVAHTFDEVVRGGLQVRVYTPEGSGPFPVLVYFHGGGWVSGDLDMHDSTCRRIANQAHCAVVNVDYRLAPEHRFPAAVEDAYEASQWARDHAHEFSGDPTTLAVAGSSSGANLAAAVTLRARDDSGPHLSLQVLIYPVIDAAMDTDSFREFAEGYMLEAKVMRWYWMQYVENQEDRQHPWASPASAQSLAGLPPAIVVTAEFDPLRDEAEAYAQRLRAEGIPTELDRYEGQVHGFMGQLEGIADADIALRHLSERIAAHLHPGQAKPGRSASAPTSANP